MIHDDYKLQIPHVLRARDFRLYLADGRRLVDLWLNGGAAILGHTPPNFLREIKNTASRGLFSPYPHFTQSRLEKALIKLFPGHNFRIYAAPPQELITLFHNRSVKLWRPFANPASPFAAADSAIFVPVVPGIQTWKNALPFGLCIVAAQSENDLSPFPANDTLSPVLLAATARGIYDIIAATDRVKTNFSRLNKALKNSRWKKSGIYLTLKEEIKKEEWDLLFNKFLEAGFLLPPSQSFPLILPAEMSKGEEVKLAEVVGL